MSVFRVAMVCAFMASITLALPAPSPAESRAEASEKTARPDPQGEASQPVGPRRELSDPYAPRPVIDRPGTNRNPMRGTRRGTRVSRPGARGSR